MIKFVRLATGCWFSPGTLVSSTNNSDHHDITEILLKVALNAINQTFGESGLIRRLSFGESGLIRGLSFGESGLIRGLSFGESEWPYKRAVLW